MKCMNFIHFFLLQSPRSHAVKVPALTNSDVTICDQRFLCPYSSSRVYLQLVSVFRHSFCLSSQKHFLHTHCWCFETQCCAEIITTKLKGRMQELFRFSWTTSKQYVQSALWLDTVYCISPLSHTQTAKYEEWQTSIFFSRNKNFSFLSQVFDSSSEFVRLSPNLLFFHTGPNSMPNCRNLKASSYFLWTRVCYSIPNHPSGSQGQAGLSTNQNQKINQPFISYIKGI